MEVTPPIAIFCHAAACPGVAVYPSNKLSVLQTLNASPEPEIRPPW